MMKTIPALLMAFAISYSAIPSGMLFQGSFAEDGSSATKSITVKVCDAPIDGICHTAFTGDVTTVRNHFAVTLNTSVMDFTKSLYLETIVNSVIQGERIPLTAAPYAHHSLLADNAYHADDADYASTAGTATLATTATNATNATYASTAGSAQSAVTADMATTAQIAQRIPLIEPSDNTITFEAANMVIEDTLIMKSKTVGVNQTNTAYRGMLSSPESVLQWMRSETTTPSSYQYSQVTLDQDSLDLFSQYGSKGAGYSSHLTILPNKMRMSTDTVIATKGQSATSNQFIKTDAIQLVRKQPFGYMGGENIEDCTENIVGTIMLQAAYATSVNTLLICMYNGSIAIGDRYRWYPIILGNYYDY